MRVFKYPFTTFHQMNLDWFLEQFRELVSDWNDFHDTITEEWEAYQSSVNDRVDGLESDFGELQHDFEVLYNYVHDYFDNLDVQSEIDHKLDEMLLDGTLGNLVKPYVTRYFNTLSDLSNDTALAEGSIVGTVGYYSVNDGGGALYYIASTAGSGWSEVLTSGLYAQLITGDVVNMKQLGAKGDNTTDVSSILQSALTKFRGVYVPNGVYRLENPVMLTSRNRITGESASNYITTGCSIFNYTGAGYAFTTDNTTSSSGVELRTFKIMGNGSNSGVQFGNASYGCYDVIMEHVIVQSVVTAFEFANAWTVDVSRCIANVVTTGFLLGTYEGGTGSTFNDCMVYSAINAWVFESHPWKSTVLNGCGCDIADIGMWFKAGRNIVINGAHLEDYKVSAFKFSDAFASADIIGANMGYDSDAGTGVAVFDILALAGCLSIIGTHNPSNHHTGINTFHIDAGVDLRFLSSR